MRTNLADQGPNSSPILIRYQRKSAGSRALHTQKLKFKNEGPKTNKKYLCTIESKTQARTSLWTWAGSSCATAAPCVGCCTTLIVLLLVPRHSHPGGNRHLHHLHDRHLHQQRRLGVPSLYDGTRLEHHHYPNNKNDHNNNNKNEQCTIVCADTNTGRNWHVM